MRLSNHSFFAKRLLFLCLLFWSSQLVIAQIHSSGTVGVLVGLGKPMNRIGLTANLSVYNTHVQVDIGSKIYYNFSNYGPPLKYWEAQPQVGFLATWGKQNESENPFYYTYLQRQGRTYAFGYQFQYYWNTIETQQSTGTLLVQLKDLSVQFENDIFGNTKGRDRFRTGAVRILYQREDLLFEIKSVLWTGETRGKDLVTCREPGAYPCRWGFKDISKLPFGKYAHGVLAAQVHYALSYRQAAQVGLGIDSEHIRNFIQNKVIHDMYFLPKSLVQTKNLHYPMLDEDGMPYLYQTEQTIRKKKLFWHFGVNNEGFY